MIQHGIAAPTTAPVDVQYAAIEAVVAPMIAAAAALDVRILCLQELWHAPFFLCTRERLPWCEFAEPCDATRSRSLAFVQNMARTHSMTIFASMLERDEAHLGTIHNTCVVVTPAGILGKHRKVRAERAGGAGREPARRPHDRRTTMAQP